MKNFKILLFIFSSIFLILIDFLIKRYIKVNYELLEINNIIGIFNLTFLQNKGIAFSMLSEYEGSKSVFLITTKLAFICGLLVYAYVFRDNLLKVVFSCLILAGAVGNLIDSVCYGYVVDYLHFMIGKYSFPIFNFADVVICLGAIGLCFMELGVIKEKEA